MVSLLKKEQLKLNGSVAFNEQVGLKYKNICVGLYILYGVLNALCFCRISRVDLKHLVFAVLGICNYNGIYITCVEGKNCGNCLKALDNLVIRLNGSLGLVVGV
jgi:hypothetical protein